MYLIHGKTEVESFWLRLNVSMAGDQWISTDNEFKMTGATERKKRGPKLVLDGLETRKYWSKVSAGWSMDKKVLVRGAKGKTG